MSDDDKKTVVLDMNALKNELKKQNDLTSNPQDLEFVANTNSDIDISGLDDNASESKVTKVKTLFFDYKSEYFKNLISDLPNEGEYHILNDVKSLSVELKKKENILVVFNYNTSSKATNQLCAQIKQKFKHVNTLICAKGLSADKVKAHQSSASGANFYLSLPINPTEFKEILNKLS